MSLRIKTDDEVIVISGKDRGKRGKVLRVDAKRDKVLSRALISSSATSAPSRCPARSGPSRSAA